ncbi:hypothetical protein [Streptomyces sp. NPDC056987]|uniref:hypothetical protein n=1 Tax=Streptomyces sp. NPDC056987 TaxID=3345988 RepID=UPI00362FE2BA
MGHQANEDTFWYGVRNGEPFGQGLVGRLHALGRAADADMVTRLCQGTPAEAETWFRATAEQEPEDESPSKFMMAEFLSHGGRNGEAEGWYRLAALATDGGHDVLSAAEALGDLLAARGACEKAETWYRRAYYGDDSPGSIERRPLTERSRPIDYAHRQPSVAHKRAANLLSLGKAVEADAFLAEVDEYKRRNPTRGPAEVVTTAVLAGALVPFLQTLITKAGEDSYQAARAVIGRWARALRRTTPAPPPDSGPEERPGAEGVVVRISTHVSDEALGQLAALDFAAIRQAMGGAIEVSWDEDLSEWRIIRSR